MVAERAASRGFSLRCFQTNHEGEFVEKLHQIAREGAAGVLMNPGAWTHYSYAIRDALELVQAPIAEIHLSAIDEREEWRRLSVIADLATVRISGMGPTGYMDAVESVADASVGRRRPVSRRRSGRATAAPHPGRRWPIACTVAATSSRRPASTP